MRTFAVALTMCTALLLVSFSKATKNENYISYNSFEDTLKVNTFNILENKCNDCHKNKKPEFVFTPENMDAFVAVINMQVFIKQKMPKGRAVKLTEEELAVLEKWVKATMK